MRHCERQVRAGELRPATAQFYREKAGHWTRLLGADARLAALTAEHVDEYLDARRIEGATEHTLAKELVALRIALKLMKRAKRWTGDLGEILPVGFRACYVPRNRSLAPLEAVKLLSQLRPDRAARVAWILATGSEWAPTDDARRDDVDADRTMVHVRGTKTRTRDRFVPIVMPWQRQLLEFALVHAGGTDGRLFTPWLKVHQDLAAACARVDRPTASRKRTECLPTNPNAIPACTPNDLRRTYAQWFVQLGMPLDVLAPAMGHASTAMLQKVYGRLAPEHLADRMRAAVGLSANDPGCSTVVATSTGAVAALQLVQPAAARSAGKKPRKAVGHFGLEPKANGLRVLPHWPPIPLTALKNPPGRRRAVAQLKQTAGPEVG